jgi:hypothetical protein
MRNTIAIIRALTLPRLAARLGAMASVAAFLSAAPFHAALAQTAPSLGAASGFSVLGGTAVTCTDSVIVGDVGSGGAFTNTRCTIGGGMPPATNAAAGGARTAFLSAYAALQLQSSSCVFVAGNLATANLGPGVYCIEAVAKAGTLTLTGGPNDVWIFLVNGALTGTDFTVVMNGGQPCNVFWAPSGGVTMTTSTFKGNILAGAPATAADPGSITLTGGTLAGRALANVAVTMTNASVIGCSALTPPTGKCDADDDHDKDHDQDHGKDHDDGHDKDHDDGHDKDNGHGH